MEPTALTNSSILAIAFGVVFCVANVWAWRCFVRAMLQSSAAGGIGQGMIIAKVILLAPLAIGGVLLIDERSRSSTVMCFLAGYTATLLLGVLFLGLFKGGSKTGIANKDQ